MKFGLVDYRDFHSVCILPKWVISNFQLVYPLWLNLPRSLRYNLLDD
jgi:hypothetical protein